jgi:hypothetical protein
MPPFAMATCHEQEERKMKLSERAMLVTLNIGQWSGMALDREVSDEISESHRAEKDAGRYSKRIIATKFLSHVGGKINVARRSHRLLTLPWDDDGTRILSVTGYEHYTQTMNLVKHGVEAATIDFVKNLPDYINEARTRLGTMFNLEDYPTADEVSNKFYIDIEMKPIPESGDFRAKLTTEAVKAITQDIENRCNARVEAAVQDVYHRVVDVTAKMSERLRAFEPGDDDAPAKNVFRDTLVSNVAELADLIPSLNITGDPKLDALATQLKDDLVEHSPEVLRADAKTRKLTADKADRLLKKAKQFLAS